MGEVWGNITQDIAHHKITTDVIKREISPDAQPLASTIRIPTVLLERLREQAQDLGLSLNSYLEQLADGQSPDGGRDVETEPLTDEQVTCLDRLELEWKLFPSADAGAEIAIFGSAPSLEIAILLWYIASKSWQLDHVIDVFDMLGSTIVNLHHINRIPHPQI